VRAGSPTGAVLGSATVPVTGGWETFTDVTGAVTGAPAGTTTLYLTFAGTGTGALYDVDAFTLATGGGPVVGFAGKCLDVNGGAAADGTKIQLWTCNGSAAQNWTVQGSTLRAVGKCLDVAGGALINGTKVQLYTCNGSAAQNWAAQPDGTLKNPQSNRCLDVSEVKSTDGQQIHIWDCLGAANQKWVLP
jgi:hypothetical protein